MENFETSLGLRVFLLFTFGFCVVMGYLAMELFPQPVPILLVIAGVAAILAHFYLRFKGIMEIAGKRKE